jgi:hypothetical protein
MGARKEQRRAGGRVALADEFLPGLAVSKGVDDVGFPFDGAVAQGRKVG